MRPPRPYGFSKRQVEVLDMKYIPMLFLTAYCIAITVQGFKSASDTTSSWLKQSQDHILLFSKPHNIRHMGFMFAAFPSVGLLVTASDSAAYWKYPIALCLTLFCLYYLAGPEDTCLNLSEKTCALTTGWPWHPRTRTKSMSEFEGLYITSRGCVMLTLKHPDWISNGFQLSGRCDTEALALAKYISDATELPLLERTGLRAL